MKDILITGGSKGIGLEFTRQYLHQGCRVFATSRQPDDFEALQQLQILYDDRLVIHKLDVADDGSRRDLFQALAVGNRKTGRLDQQCRRDLR